ncbi:hypothetical protein SUGI_0612310 [Cryptomeria japonica]|nr:hypothetical protein SUGI_0612310 [Cryptomeria japonica]
MGKFSSPITSSLPCFHQMPLESDAKQSLVGTCCKSCLKVREPEELHLKMQEENFINDAQLMDVREPNEVDIASLPGFKINPLPQFGNNN